MQHHELPHVQKFIDKSAALDEVLVLLEDMRDECAAHGHRNAAILARDSHKAVHLVQQVIAELQNRRS